jgi:Holliday junction resolvasome RuvABC endonuclease subunit
VRVLGIDFSTHAIDLVAVPWDGDRLDDAVWQRIELGPVDRDDQRERGGFLPSLRVHDRVLQRFDWDSIALVYIEDPMGVSIGAAKALGRISGAIAASLPARIRNDTNRVNPMRDNDWKRVLTGNPKASKATVRKRVEGLGFLRLGAGQDAFDAAGIAWAARHELQHPHRAAARGRAGMANQGGRL